MFDFARAGADVDSLIKQWALEPALGMPLHAALNDSTALFSNQVAQPLLVASAAATWIAIKDGLPAPSLVAGYSIGELSSYVIARALPASDAVALAVRRAQLMNQCSPGLPQAMIALSGLSRMAAGDATGRHGFHIAIETGEDSMIAGGPATHASYLEEDVIRHGGHCTTLPVNIASHTPLMHDAVAPFMQVLQAAPITSPRIPVLSGTRAELVHDRDQAISALSVQLEETIRWMDCMDACAEAGITIALELGPGSSLSRMLQARHPHIQCRSVADFRKPAGIVAWVERHIK